MHGTYSWIDPLLRVAESLFGYGFCNKFTPSIRKGESRGLFELAKVVLDASHSSHMDEPEFGLLI